MKLDSSKTRQLAEHKHEAPLLACAFDPTGRFVLAGGRDKSIVWLDLAAGKTARLEGHGTWVGAAVRTGKELVLTADFAGRVIAWDCRGDAPQARWNIEAHASAVHALAASADGRMFATGDRDGTIRVWQASDGQRLHEISGIGHPVYCLAFLPDGKRLVSADRQPKKPRLKWWDFASGQELLTIDVPQLSAYRRVEDIEWGGIRGVSLSPDGGALAACGANGYAGPAGALLFDIATGALKRKLSSTLKGFCYAAPFHPQGFLLTASGDVAKGEVRIWDADKDEPLATLATPGPCTSMDIDPAGKRFVFTQTTGKGSYPDSGLLTIHEWTE